MKRSDGVALSISMIVGISAGAVLGYFTSHWDWFIGTGLAVGMAVGIIIERFKKTRAKD